MFNSLERLFGYKFSFGCPALFIHGANSLLMSANILDNIKKMYSEIMDFDEVNGAAHHVPLDKPLEIVDIIKVVFFRFLYELFLFFLFLISITSNINKAIH